MVGDSAASRCIPDIASCVFSRVLPLLSRSSNSKRSHFSSVPTPHPPASPAWDHGMQNNIFPTCGQLTMAGYPSPPGVTAILYLRFQVKLKSTLHPPPSPHRLPTLSPLSPFHPPHLTMQPS
jgi:hypothetical protein